MSANMFGYAAGGSFQNPRVWAFNKAQMYAGAPTVQVVSFDAPAADFTVLPEQRAAADRHAAARHAELLPLDLGVPQRADRLQVPRRLGTASRSRRSPVPTLRSPPPAGPNATVPNAPVAGRQRPRRAAAPRDDAEPVHATSAAPSRCGPRTPFAARTRPASPRRAGTRSTSPAAPSRRPSRRRRPGIPTAPTSSTASCPASPSTAPATWPSATARRAARRSRRSSTPAAWPAIRSTRSARPSSCSIQGTGTQTRQLRRQRLHPLGRLQRDDARSRRLHVLVHERVLRGRRPEPPDAHRLVRLPVVHAGRQPARCRAR